MLAEEHSEAQPAQARKRRVFLVDDHPIVRNGLAQLINQEADLIVCGEASNATEAQTNVAALAPDMAIVDISLEGSSGVELTKALRELHPDLPVLVLSMHDENLYAERALRAGARGYVMKQESPELVLKAIRTVLRGDMYVSESIASRMLEDFVTGPVNGTTRTGIERLSDRELEVFEMIGKGRATRDIAKTLSLSVKTIETHRAHIKQKLKLENANELMHYAVNWVEGMNNT